MSLPEMSSQILRRSEQASTLPPEVRFRSLGLKRVRFQNCSSCLKRPKDVRMEIMNCSERSFLLIMPSQGLLNKLAPGSWSLLPELEEGCVRERGHARGLHPFQVSHEPSEPGGVTELKLGAQGGLLETLRPKPENFPKRAQIGSVELFALLESGPGPRPQSMKELRTNEHSKHLNLDWFRKVLVDQNGP